MFSKVDFDVDELVLCARRAGKHTYSPYSKFPVGAAVRAVGGQVFEGCNVENASYGLACCAERAAIFSAISSGARRINKVAVSCSEGVSEKPELQMPCGACLQVMSEFGSPDLEIIIDRVGTFRLRDLLPRPFRI